MLSRFAYGHHAPRGLLPFTQMLPAVRTTLVIGLFLPTQFIRPRPSHGPHVLFSLCGPSYNGSFDTVRLSFTARPSSVPSSPQLDPSNGDDALQWQLHSRFPALEHIEVIKPSEWDCFTDQTFAQLALKVRLTHLDEPSVAEGCVRLNMSARRHAYPSYTLLCEAVRESPCRL